MSEEEKCLSNENDTARALSAFSHTALAHLSLPAGPGDSSQDTVSFSTDMHVSSLPEDFSGSLELATT